MPCSRMFLASRLEGSGEPGRIHVAGAICAKLAPAFRLSHRGDILLKGVGSLQTWYLLGEPGATGPVAAEAAE